MSITQMKNTNPNFSFQLLKSLFQIWMASGKNKDWWWQPMKTYFRITKCSFTTTFGNSMIAQQLMRSTYSKRNYNMFKILLVNLAETSLFALRSVHLLLWFSICLPISYLTSTASHLMPYLKTRCLNMFFLTHPP